jgi:GDPmannose 4,6-dehydratase
MKKALITGVNGQDGTYLAELLLGMGYSVAGAYRKTSTPAFWRLEEKGILHSPGFSLVELDLTDLGGCLRVVSETEPGTIFNLAAQSFVGLSFREPVTTATVNGLGVMNLLEAIRIVDPKIRFYQASSSEMFGCTVDGRPHTEESLFHPRSPYAVSKAFAHWATINYRESYGLFTCCGILFNHESPLRSKDFVTRKISSAVAEISLGKRDFLSLGNMDVVRDWGYAPEYITAMERMTALPSPEDFVVATGKANSLRSFVELAFRAIGRRIIWKGSGVEETGVDAENGRELVRVDPAFFRPCEIECVVGDASKASRILGWEPRTGLDEICRIMVETDIRRIQAGFPF